MAMPDKMRLIVARLERRLVAIASDIDGATAIEYALIATLISVAIIGGATLLGSNLSATWIYVANYVSAGLAH
jgi:pilus assembly protein Flp/PilA